MYLSHFILDVSVVCERWVETVTDCYIDPTSSPDHSSTSSASWLGLLNRGSLRTTALSLQAGFHSGLPVPNSLNCRQHLPIFFHNAHFIFRLFISVHLWLTARSRVSIQYNEKTGNAFKRPTAKIDTVPSTPRTKLLIRMNKQCNSTGSAKFL